MLWRVNAYFVNNRIETASVIRADPIEGMHNASAPLSSDATVPSATKPEDTPH